VILILLFLKQASKELFNVGKQSRVQGKMELSESGNRGLGYGSSGRASF
jgi:hypothetical protein